MVHKEKSGLKNISDKVKQQLTVSTFFYNISVIKAFLRLRLMKVLQQYRKLIQSYRLSEI